ncbi:hypothetical protein BDL97_11G115600 [Sphagnum fallax]|nr:hypothetical protein BDL97_11G115600 [Sphagnum fallax]
MFEYEDPDIVVGGSRELDHIQQHRLKLIDAIGRCRILKRLDVFGRWHIEEVRVLCQNLLLHPALEELCIFNTFIDEREGAILSQMLLEQNHNILKRCSLSGRGRVSAVGTIASKPGLTFDELIAAAKELQLDMLHVGFDADDYHLVGAFREAKREHRLQLIDVVSKCQSLKRLDVRGMWNIEEVEVLCQNLFQHPALEWLSLPSISDKGAAIVCELLKKNHLLRCCSFSYGGVTAIGATSFASMLGVNCTLKFLCLYDNPLGPDGMEALLVPLTGQDEHLPLNKSLQSLSIGGAESRMGQRGAKAMARMLCTNTTLKDLHVGYEPSLTPSDVCVILESLEIPNETSRTLDFDCCEGVDGDEVLAKLKDVLQVNSWLEIGLENTPLEGAP